MGPNGVWPNGSPQANGLGSPGHWGWPLRLANGTLLAHTSTGSWLAWIRGFTNFLAGWPSSLLAGLVIYWVVLLISVGLHIGLAISFVIFPGPGEWAWHGLGGSQ